MSIDWTAVRAELNSHLDHFTGEHVHPMNRVLHLAGIPLLVLAIPTALLNPLAALSLVALGGALQLGGHFLFERNAPAVGQRGPLYLLAAPLWAAEILLQQVGLSLRQLVGFSPLATVVEG